MTAEEETVSITEFAAIIKLTAREIDIKRYVNVPV
jgi:hypothetical protein